MEVAVKNELQFKKEYLLNLDVSNKSTVSIVIPFYDNWQLTHQCLMDVWKRTKVLEVILVNDGSTKNVDGAVAWWQKETDLPLVYVKNEKNLGFGRSMNKGIWAAQGDIVVLLSNDVRISGDVIKQVLSVVDHSILVGDTLYNFNTGWNVFSMPDGDRLFPYLGGYFLAAYRDSFIELGGFDDRYGKFDYEDVDLSTTAVYMGYDLVAINSRYLHHISGQTAGKNPDREFITRSNRDKFYAKWKRILYESSGEFGDNY